MKKENKKLIWSIVAVALTIVLVGGGTYAYWSWASANNTAVTFTVSGGTLTIDGGGNITTKTLAPASCYNTSYAIQRKIKVTASNDTTTDMVETIQLKISKLENSGREPNDTHKAYIKWALVRSDSTQHANSSSWLLTSKTACDTAATTTASELDTKGKIIGRGTFASFDDENNTEITLYNKDIAAKKASSTASAVTTTDYYELYIWIDPSYGDEDQTGTIYPTQGSSVSDPLQGLTLNLVWQGTMTNQIS